MEVLHSRCAGLDLSKKDAKVCVRIVPDGKARAVETVTTWSLMTGDILALRDHLVAQAVTCVVMEATGDYWKPFYYLLEDCEFEVMLVNAGRPRTCPAVRPMCLMRPGWPSSPRTGCCGPRSFRPSRSVSCGI